MADNPRPGEDENWTINDELEENTEEEQETEEEDKSRFNLSRRQAIAGIGVTAVGGYLAAGAYADNIQGRNQDTDIRTELKPVDEVENTDTPTPDNTPDETTENTPEDEPTETPVEEENIYELEDGITVDLDSLDPVFENSEVDIGVQKNGNLVAWNQNVEVTGNDGNTYNPLYRFRSDAFPDREFYEVGVTHPIEQLYSDLDAEVDEMSEGMVKVFYDEEHDEGSWEDHQEYISVDYQELKEGLLEYSGLGPTQDYFFNRRETLRHGEETLEKEWEELIRDGLEQS